MVAHWLARLLVGSVAAMALPAAADEVPTLSGPGVITFRHLEVPFVSSTRFVRQGTVIDGGCRYASDMKLAAGELPPGHSMVRVVRAHDPAACRELVEQGLVPSAALARPPAAGASTNSGRGTLQMVGPGSVSTTIPSR